MSIIGSIVGSPPSEMGYNRSQYLETFFYSKNDEKPEI